jgi:hypothetical protein
MADDPQNGTPQPTPTPQPPHAGRVIHTDDDGAWVEGQAIPYARWQKTTARLHAFEQERTALQSQLAALQAERDQARALATRHEQDAVLIGAGIRAESVRRALRREHADYAAEAGQSAKPFAEWINEAKADPLFAPHFAPSAPPAAPAPTQGGATPGAPNAGAASPPAPKPSPGNPNAGVPAAQVPAGHRFSDEEVAAMTPSQFAANRAVIEQQAIADGLIRAPRAARG